MNLLDSFTLDVIGMLKRVKIEKGLFGILKERAVKKGLSITDYVSYLVQSVPLNDK